MNKKGNDYSGSFSILVGEAAIAFKEAGFTNSNEDPSGSATINLELTAGERVRVQNVDSSVVYGTAQFGVIESWFTGHLLYVL